jgi:hypothetical protein
MHKQEAVVMGCPQRTPWDQRPSEEELLQTVGTELEQPHEAECRIAQFQREEARYELFSVRQR